MLSPLDGTLPCLLIVDDLEEIHDMIKSLVAPLGFLCAAAPGGEEALALYRQSRFDVVVVDFAMTPMDGLALARALRELEPEVVVVLMSGFVDDEVRRAAKEAGAYSVVEKPFRMADFGEVLKDAVNEAHRRSSPRVLRSDFYWPSLAAHLAERERSYMALVLEAMEGDVARAADVLEISPERFGKSIDPR